MDLSKLPKLSQTPAPPPTDSPDTQTAAPNVELFCRCGAPISPGTKFCSNCGASYGEATGRPGSRRPAPELEGMGPEAWLSVAVGAILIFMAPDIWKYYLTSGTGILPISDVQGNLIPYRESAFYWSHLGLAAFSIVLFLEALVMLFARKAPLVALALTLTIAATLLNVYVINRVHSAMGFPILNALAAAFGVYIAMFEFSVMRSLKSGRRP